MIMGHVYLLFLIMPGGYCFLYTVYMSIHVCIRDIIEIKMGDTKER